MKKTRESSTSQIGIAEKRNLVACLANMGFTHIEITMYGETNANLISEGFTPSPLSIEAETQQWYDVIHAQPNRYGGYMKVYDRTVFCGIEGISGFAYDTATPIGTASSASTDGESTWCGRYYRYLRTNVGASHIETGDIQCPIPEITGQAFGGNFFTDQAGAKSCVSHFRTIANAFYAENGKTCVFLNNPNFSEVTSGWWDGAYSENGIVCYDYYGGARGTGKVHPGDYAYEINQVYAGTSPTAGYGIGTADLPQFIGEWGDLSNSISINGTRSGDNFATGSTNLYEWVDYWRRYLNTMTDLVDAGKVIGYNYWGGWEDQNTSILDKSGSGASSQYFPNWRGQMLSHYLLNGRMARNPIINNGTYTEASPSFGGRDMFYT